MSEPEIKGIDGTVRKEHYGKGRQPWDDIKDMGWGEQFAAGNVLKYIKRYQKKNGRDDVEKARWYWTELKKFSNSVVADHLTARLTMNEIDILNGDNSKIQLRSVK